jgi:hypothetical protein
MLCQGDAMKKDISLELAVIPQFLLVVAIIDVTGRRRGKHHPRQQKM